MCIEIYKDRDTTDRDYKSGEETEMKSDVSFLMCNSNVKYSVKSVFLYS